MISTMSRQRRRHVTENYLVIWVDDNIDMANKDDQHTLAPLRNVVNQVNPCTTGEQHVQQLSENPEETSFVISSDALGQHLVPNIHSMPKLDVIYTICDNKQRHQVWVKNLTKIQGIHTFI
ncbi:unnamed protein product [Rotaria sp. Silwood2]|nr:unnamed protein product [Rotaria sp. Silwood2]CAF2938497.1 unnamed protein product [Rotaria sp. Silwood2]CAF3856777.1 unnamed protein product [Rotaria sp. Silwood2]CAF4049253.1 unnamed protein product [Rotaria sp. Silwood2]